jgi:transcriptional regulator with XRE-family HTH domain
MTKEDNMILADKIIENRKKNGWSQEELADKLGVSRQSVSKWEGAQSIPDMKKILQLADLFGVTTDYLLKDEIEVPVMPEQLPVDSEPGRQELLAEEDIMRNVSMEEANSYLALSEQNASLISTGVMLCILSPVLLIALSGLAENGRIPLGEQLATMIGSGLLLVMVASAVGMFLTVSFRSKPYSYLDKARIETAYGVTGMVRERKTNYAPTYSRLLTIGIVLCVIAAIPIVLCSMLHHDDGTLNALGVAGGIAVVALGVRLIVQACVRQGGFDRLLEEGDYTRLNKRISRYDAIYWCLVTALYLAVSFLTMRWDRTWIVWPVAGVLFAVHREIVKMLVK